MYTQTNITPFGAMAKSSNYLKPGINVVTLGQPNVQSGGNWNAIVFPFFKNNNACSDVKVFIPSGPTKWATMDELLIRAAKDITEIYNVFIPMEKLQAAGTFTSLQEMMSAFNKLLPEGFDKTKLDVAAAFKYNKKDKKSYLNVANHYSLAKHLDGERWIAIHGAEPGISWGEDFEKLLERIPEETVTTSDSPFGDDSDATEGTDTGFFG